METKIDQFFKKYSYLFSANDLNLNEKTIIHNNIAGVIRNYFQISKAKKIIGVADRNTWSAAGEVYLKACENAGIEGEEYIFNNTAEELLPDEKAVANITALGNSSNVLFVAIGSGTINDIVRYAAFHTGNKFISIPTAPSMDGYASSVCPLVRNGIKITVPAAVPERIFIQPSILTSSPSVMVSAGVGDLLGKYCSILDWKLSSAVTGESYNYPLAEMVAAKRDAFFSEKSDNFLEEDAQLELVWNLIISGLAISVANSSRPASGSEHHISHLLEMRFLQGIGKHYLHGQTVGLGTWIIINIYAQLLPLSIKEIIERFNVHENRKDRFADAYGCLSEQFFISWEKKESERMKIGKKLKANPEIWDMYRKSEKFSDGFIDKIKNCLVNANISKNLSDYGYTKDEIRNVVISAKEIRDRFTILEFLDCIGCLEGVAAQIVENIF